MVFEPKEKIQAEFLLSLDQKLVYKYNFFIIVRQTKFQAINSLRLIHRHQENHIAFNEIIDIYVT